MDIQKWVRIKCDCSEYITQIEKIKLKIADAELPYIPKQMQCFKCFKIAEIEVFELVKED